MGWTSTVASCYKNGKVDVKLEMDTLCGKNYQVLKSSMVGSTYYGALKNVQTGVVFCAVILTSTKTYNGFNLSYKDMTEDEGPCERKCPMGILNLLTPTDNQYAIEWRNACREYHNKKNSDKHSWLVNVGIGERVYLNNSDGTADVLIKHPPAYQFKTWFWYNTTRGTYVSKKYVTEENTRPYVA